MRRAASSSALWPTARRRLSSNASSSAPEWAFKQTAPAGGAATALFGGGVAKPAAEQRPSASAHESRLAALDSASSDASELDVRTIADPSYPWDAYMEASSALVDEPSSQLHLLQARFATPEGAAATRAEHPDLHFSFLPNARLGAELREARQRFLGTNFEEPSYEQRLARQLMLEERAYADAVLRFRKTDEGYLSRGDVAHHSVLQRRMQSWDKPLSMAIKREQRDISENLRGVQDRNSYGKYLKLLPPEVLSVITMHQVFGAVVPNGERGAIFSRCAITIGQEIYKEVKQAILKARRKLDNDWKAHSERKALFQTLEQPGSQTTSARGKQLEQGRAVLEAREKELQQKEDLLPTGMWDAGIRVRIGGVLIGLLLHTLTMKTKDPVTGELVVVHPVEHDYLHNADKTVLGILRGHQSLLDLVKGDYRTSKFINPRQLPMVVKPRAWTSPDCGGYISPNTNTFFVRVRHSHEHREKLREVDRMGEIDQVLSGISALGSMPWRINQPVFDVVNSLWNFDGGVGGLVSKHKGEEPERPKFEGFEWQRPLPKEQLEEQEQAHAKWRFKLRSCFKTNRELHSLGCDTQLKLQVAKELLHSTFYFPHNLDFRGRAYPIPPHLHHLGADMSRGILHFNAGKPLGESGLQWLKVHVANLWGNDKLSNVDRAQFVEDNIEQLKRCAKDPLATEESRFWLQEGAPFQLLAAVLDLAAALELPDPTQHISHLPVHQDGSCNGLQHYAALARDRVGAEQVNLVDSPMPMDVYSGVARILQEKVQADREGAEKESERELAELLHDKISRKVVKQTVMTSVYGVTYVGAREQIARRLEEIEGFPENKVWDSSCYLARLVLSSIGDSFKGAQSTMDFLSKWAQVIGQQGEAVKWVTPLGLPIMQPYKAKTATRAVNTVVQSVIIAINNDFTSFHKSRQRTAFAPNFIHSLDSSHMLRTANSCSEEGIAFAEVHDSFWTHASTVDDMNKTLRTEFVNLHSESILQNLNNDFMVRYPSANKKRPELPDMGDLDLKEVLGAKYFFS